MSSSELRRVEVLARVKSKELRLRDAAALLEVSYRHAKRLWRRYWKQGAGGLKHRSAGKVSNRAKPEKFRKKVLQEGASEIFGRRGQAVWTYAGSRALDGRGWTHSRSRNATAMDVEGGAVEPDEKAMDWGEPLR
jgi:hypothetical protein